MYRLFLIIASLCVAATGSHASPALGYEVYAKPGDQFGTAQFKMWIPDRHAKLSGILVLMPGSNGYVLELSNDTKWQKVTSDWNFALLTVYFTGSISPNGSPAGDSDYWWSSDGDDALLDAIQHFSQRAQHPELADAPLALIGRSAGALFDYHFALRHPERVLAFVPIKGANNLLDPTPGLREVPALWLVGEKDGHKQFIKKGKDLFTANRFQGAPWCYALEMGAGHETGKTLQLALPYLHGMISQRLDATGKLVPVDQSRGYLGDLAAKNAVPYAAYRGNPKEAAWLPDSASAKVWEAFVSGTLAKDPECPILDYNDYGKASPPYGNATPSNWDMGEVPIDGPVLTQQITVTRAPTDPPWDEAFCPDSWDCLNVTPHKIDANTWAFDVRFDPSSLSLGWFKADLHLRFKWQSQILLGGRDIPLTGHIVGNIAAAPPALYAGILASGEKKSMNLEFESKNGIPLQFVSVSDTSLHPELVEVTPEAAEKGRLKFRCSFTGKENVGRVSGKLLFKIKSTKTFTVSVLFIAEVQDELE